MPAIVGRVYSCYTIVMEFFDLLGQDRSTAAAKNFYMPATIFLEEVFHVFEKFHMPALVTGDGNSLDVFFNRGFHDFPYATVMTQVDDLGAFALHNAAHD